MDWKNDKGLINLSTSLFIGFGFGFVAWIFVGGEFPLLISFGLTIFCLVMYGLGME